MRWLLVVVGILGWVIARETWGVRSQMEKKIFILAGQSNMAGRGGVVNDTVTGIARWDGVVPRECRGNRWIVRLNAGLEWVEAQEPLHQDIDETKTNGIGPGMAFGNRILKKKKKGELGVVGLVPCAIGGSNISEWERGKVLYNQMMRRAKASLQQGGTISALLWYQGESDTLTYHDAHAYATRLRKFFSDVRDQLHSPLLPIIQVALASGSGPYIETVREAQLGMDLLNLRTVDAKGFPLEPDGLHLSTSAQVHLGHMMADAFLPFLPTSLQSAAPLPSKAPPTVSNLETALLEGKYIEKVNWGSNCLTSTAGLRLKSDHLHLTTMSEVHLRIKLPQPYLSSST
ncbi:putative carbohydrate esterase [Senna tora]|uniref:Putative carbohydrate esterase n=1 Tax=Senna tora TaxID=362788 RepID=A0A834T9I2_9FABA|nr:putative carbohydrate esterase [Senna tora]